MDDIGISANNATDFTLNIRAVFMSIGQAGSNLTIENCHFGVKQIEFLGRTILSEGVSPQTHKIQNFLHKLRFPKSIKALQCHLGFVNYYRFFFDRVAEALNPFNKLLKPELPINITSELRKKFDPVSKALSGSCHLELKQTLPGKQIVFMTNASSRNASYALLIEDYPDQETQSKRKTYAPVAFGSKIFSPAQLKMSIYWKKFQAICITVFDVAHILLKMTKVILVLTDNKLVTLFFLTKAISPALWNACDYVWQFNFKVAYIAGSVSTATNIFSRLELKVRKKIRLKIWEDVQTTTTEVTTSSSDVSEKEVFFFTQTDGGDDTEEYTI